MRCATLFIGEGCMPTEIEAVMSLMDTSCHSTLQNALTRGTTLDNSTRYECFMEFNPIVAKNSEMQS